MASDYLLELDGIKGESKDDFKRGNLQIESFSWGVSNAGASGQGVSHKAFHFTKKVDKSSPLLFQTCCTGKHIPKAVLYGRKSTTDPASYYTITLTDILISGYEGETEGGDIPTDSFSLNYSKIKFDYIYRSTTVSSGDISNTGGTP
ncbi:MAG: type secretion system secreted protein Hcp [Solirubrobacterales bacterium]|jgi:type VI secretion system secreted protein Hcp|nr:type secretion system secreted protein Hcp [Solirubrobacterales bacterium]